MRAVVQRVRKAEVFVEGKRVAHCGPGLIAFVALEKGDGEGEIRWLAEKLLHLRLFPGEDGKLSRSLGECEGELLLVSNFTVAGSLKKGTRPDFSRSLPRQEAQPLYEELVEYLTSLYPRVQSGTFGAMMEIAMVQDGPVTIVLDSHD